MPKLTKQIVEWVEKLDSHSIYDAAALAADYTKTTGEQPCWQTYSTAETRALIRQRGLGGSVEDNGGQCAYGYTVAAALAIVFANYRSAMMGRGSQFRDCVGALRTLLAEQDIETAKLKQSARQ